LLPISGSKAAEDPEEFPGQRVAMLASFGGLLAATDEFAEAWSRMEAKKEATGSCLTRRGLHTSRSPRLGLQQTVAAQGQRKTPEEFPGQQAAMLASFNEVLPTTDEFAETWSRSEVKKEATGASSTRRHLPTSRRSRPRLQEPATTQGWR
jgi:hypothetical protein